MYYQWDSSSIIVRQHHQGASKKYGPHESDTHINLSPRASISHILWLAARAPKDRQTDRHMHAHVHARTHTRMHGTDNITALFFYTDCTASVQISEKDCSKSKDNCWNLSLDSFCCFWQMSAFLWIAPHISDKKMKLFIVVIHEIVRINKMKLFEFLVSFTSSRIGA